MHDISKIIVFLFVLILLFYMINLALFIKKKWGLKTNTFIMLLSGLTVIVVATFLDMAFSDANNKFLYILIKACFTVGAIFYAVGVILWSNYTKMITEKFEEMALKDSMTGVFNRKGVEKLYKSISEAKAPFYLCVCDLDGLKKINDKFGHLDGDKYIASSVQIICDNVGATGYVGRIGGDEFIIILKHQNLAQIEKMSYSIKKSVTEIFSDIKTGISIGYASFPGEGESLDDLIRVADERMYKDKESK